MKSMRTVLGSIFVASLGLISALAQMPSGNRVNNTETITMTSNTYSIAIAQTVQPISPSSVELSFKSAAANTFTFDYTRGGYTNMVIDKTVTNWITYIWFSPRDLKLITNDRLVFTKSRNDTAQLTINWK